MQKCVCDICGRDEPQRHFKIKERKLMFCYDGQRKLPKWQEVDICDKCFESLTKLRYESSLYDRVVDEVIDSNYWTNTFKDSPNMQSSYLDGVQHCLDILLPERVKEWSEKLNARR